MSGVDSLLGLQTNGIFVTNSDGVTMQGVDGVTMSGVDGVAYTGANGVTMSGVDGVTMSGVDGLLLTGANGVTMAGVDGTIYKADSVIIRQANGVTMSGVDGVAMAGVDGFRQVPGSGVTMSGVDGVTMSGVDGIAWNSADQLVATGTNGVPFAVAPNGVTMSGVDSVVVTKAQGVTMSGVDGATMSGVDSSPVPDLNDSGQPTGLTGIDPELAVLLNSLTDDRNINAVVVYHHAVTDADIADLLSIGIKGGTRFRQLPMVMLSGTSQQICSLSKLPAVRYISRNRTLQWNEDNSRRVTGLARMRDDADLSRRNGNFPFTGKGVSVAVLDTGLDTTHTDISDHVISNVKLADSQGVGVGFNAPVNVENLQNTDAVQGHGTFVAGIIAGNGLRGGGKYRGYAPGARLVGLSAGDANLFHVLAGFDYLLAKGAGLGVRVVNCSFSANTLYDENDPVNIATKMLTGRGINVVFSAGNAGPGLHSMNPYAVAPWVISVGATDGRGKLADFSSRGDFGSHNFRPTLVAPGVDMVSLRATGTNITGAAGLLLGADTKQFSAAELPYYTTSSGTSFSAPQVTGTIALMLEANPRLTPAEVRDILQRTATPLPPYYQHEIGAGMLNAHAAVLEAAFPERRMGVWRASLNRNQVSFIKEQSQVFSGTTSPAVPSDSRLQVPNDAVMASAQIGWGPMWSTNDLGLTLYDAQDVEQANENVLNTPGLTGKRERALVRMPTGGQWRVRVSNKVGLAGTPQTYMGIFETARAEYAPLRDLNGLSAEAYSNIRQAIRMCVAWPVGENFRPAFGVTRADLAAAMVVGGRIPQYLPAQPNFTDTRDATTMSFVESVQNAPDGALFPDTPRGGAFRPDELVSRLTASIVLVRAAGLQAEAESYTGGMSYADSLQIPYEWRGYVAIAVKHELVQAGSLKFNPQQSFTRADLAHALVIISKIHDA